jgi:hypothetical protein
VKGLVLIICILALTLELQQDGTLVKAKLLAPHTPVRPLITSPHQYVTGDYDSWDLPPPSTMLVIPHHSTVRLSTPAAHGPLKLIDYCHFSSSGGIPANYPAALSAFSVILSKFLTFLPLRDKAPAGRRQ